VTPTAEKVSVIDQCPTSLAYDTESVHFGVRCQLDAGHLGDHRGTAVVRFADLILAPNEQIKGYVSGDPWERIPPGMAPGGLVFRLTAAGRIFAEHPVAELEGIDKLAEADGDLANYLVELYGQAVNYVYDGDTGECVQTVIVGGE